jgi:NADPH-dependent curcumin reductase CurA
MPVSREVRLRRRPSGVPTLDHFDIAAVDIPTPGAGEAQVRNLWLSVDPYMRGLMDEQTPYYAPFPIGGPMFGGAVGEVVSSNAPSLETGDIVYSMMGWRETFNAPAETLQKIDTNGQPAQLYLGALGDTGMTAYAGMTLVAGVKAGETVFVSGAAGAVGSVACQIAKLKGATVIGSAGGIAKTRFMREIGVDRTIDYKAEPDLSAAIAAAAPDGIDIFFDNVGGDHFTAALDTTKQGGRVIMCGMVSGYNATTPPLLPSNFMNIILRGLTVQGFVLSDYRDAHARFIGDMIGWMESGRMASHETVDDGIEAAPAAFLRLFNGESVGKMLVRLT